MRIEIVISFVAIIGLISCKRKNFDDPVLNLIHKEHPELAFNAPIFGYKDTTIFEDQKVIEYVYLDTLDGYKQSLLFVHYDIQNEKYSLWKQAQDWHDDEYENYVTIDEIDTLRHYKRSKITNEATFFIGEYYYKYFRALGEPKDTDIIIYYELYGDSLTRIRGTNLPPLPSPTDEERRRWNLEFGSCN